MNAHAHLAGQITNQMSNQVSGPPQQIGNYMAPQMQSLGPRPVDSELQDARITMQHKIYNILQRRKQMFPDEWVRRLPELVKRLEERIFKDATREEYLNLASEPVELRLFSIIKNVLNHNRPLSHHITSSSTVSTMIPTPGVPNNGSAHAMIPVQPENPTIATSNTAIASQTAANTGNLLINANGPTDAGNSASFNASDGTVSSGYQQQSATFTLGSGGSNIMSSMASTNISRQFGQMIPTPGLNSQQAISANSDCSSGAGFSSNEPSVAPQSVHQKKYVSSQNSHISHNLGAQIGGGMRSNVLHKGSSYGFSNGLANGALGLIGDNMQLSGPTASDGFLSPAPYASSSKPLLQNFDQQHHQSRIPTSLSQQILPNVDGNTAKANDVKHSETFHGPDLSGLSAMSNMSSVNLHPKARTNSGFLNHHASLQSMRLPLNVRPQMTDQSENISYHSSQSAREHLLQSQQHVQQSSQQPNQAYAPFPQNQHQLLQRHQQSMQHQQLIVNTDSLRKSLVTSHFGEQLMPGYADVTCSDTLIQSAAQQVRPPEVQAQYHQNSSSGDHSKSAQLLGHLPSSQDFHVPVSEGLQQLHPHLQSDGFSNKFGRLSSGSQAEELLQFEWHPQPLQAQMLDKPPGQQPQEEFHQRIAGQNEAQLLHLSARELDAEHGDSIKQQNYLKQIRWLLFLHHARRCPAPKGLCTETNCIKVQELICHMDICKSELCKFPRCSQSRKLVKHIRTCQAADCPVCTPVHDHIAANYKAHARALSNTSVVFEIKANSDGMKKDTVPTENSEDWQSASKRMKVQHASPFFPKSETSLVCAPSGNQPYDFQEVQSLECKQTGLKMSANSGVIVKMDGTSGSGQEKIPVFGSDIDGNMSLPSCEKDPDVSNTVDSHVKQENMVVDEVLDQATAGIKQDPDNPPTDQITASKSGKPKIKGVSLTELFTPEQIKEHIIGLRRWVGQSKAKAEKNQAMERSMTENSCQLCAVEKLTFEPPPIYCSPCGARIKRNAFYYTIGSGETRHYFCIPCYNEARGETIEAEGSTFLKTKLEKKRNDEETEEWWVQCDKCEAWQHQICALFNGRRNDGEAEYTCPNCYVEEIESGERKPLSQSAVLGAKDLPRTILSDHIEQRLFRRLKQEKQERAKHLGKNFDDVPGAEGLVIRVVSSVDKKLEVKQRFLEIFHEENYPKEFPYKSKAILLFQKIEGVEVCLFGMYVQEFGSECSFPNQRRVYLSYLDSVKYFRPEIKTVTGEALRTFVYHEILIGYLEYCKIRGFTSCYIWACPPLKGEDYILYCHPEIQKTPKSDKLREWYLTMLRKASKENIVVDLTNLYDHFFVTMGECKAKITAARLPYFDGDYWPGAAEDLINQLRQEEDGRKQMKKGKTKKTITKRALKAAGHSDLSGNASKDALLMQKLGETICPMKEDFIMVHLQHACTHCCMLLVRGTRWACSQCKNFQLCDKCHEAEQRVDERERHPTNSREKHMLYPVEINDVTQDTKDKDDILESEFFDTRQAFLSLCQGNHYQYDTLRRAKHSSMMILYHLHNPTAPAFVTTCIVCHHDIEAGLGWRCESCPDFDVCNACYQKGGIDHAHKLTNHPSMADRDAQNKEARAKRVLQLRKMLDLLVHASQCRSPQCQYPNCRKVKGLFRHGIQCRTRASGGCVLCKKMWYLLQIHSRACKESECSVPRCRDLKEHLRRLQQQSDSRRRAAVMEMMRQRAAEVAANSG
ncbi:probable histone acetyltransferase HAC-like 1 isoform X1 [Musa acuminata AAA Group]|uniref:probable histone acetyltransferase HAC-like 1 isoform X1 n=1 Tax=Musa acuminata AAA Group TaxID=214697 RepID=UPI0031DE0568